MTKRTNQTDRTRQAIIDAATEMVFGNISPEEVTMQNVADAAGVSHRTLYRYFESRQALFNAVGAAYDEQMEETVAFDVLQSFDSWVGNVENVIAFGAAHRETLRRALNLSVVSGEWRTDRDEKYWQMFRNEFPNLDADVAREDFAVLRHVLGAGNSFLIGERFELNSQGVASGVQRGLDALVADIRQRDAAASKKGRKS
ncbi:MAG: TetR/AcrR family transcriptional regulator [Acidimicrobiia bacterium]